MVMSCVWSVGSGRVFGVSAVDGRVGVGVDDDAAQPVSRTVRINITESLSIFNSINKYT
jgi:hypothetical protein